MELNTTVVYKHLEKSTKRIICMQGGPRSSNSYNVMLWLVMKMLKEENKALSVVRVSLSANEGSTERDFINILTTLWIYDPENRRDGSRSYVVASIRAGGIFWNCFSCHSP